MQGQPWRHPEEAEVGEEHHQEEVGEVVECCHQLPCLLPLQAVESSQELQTGDRQLHYLIRAGLHCKCAVDIGSSIQT